MSNKSKTKEEAKPIEFVVGEQLASDARNLAKGRSDPRRLSLINEPEVLALSYLNQIPDNEGGAYVRDFISDFLNLKMSKDGWRANQLIRLVQGSKGVVAGEIVKKPGILGRTLTNRDWKEKAERDGATIVE